jgi:hypothetical protein
MWLRKQIRPSLGELNISPGFMLPELAALDRQLETRAVFAG